MLIIDAHLDLSWNALQWDRDLLNAVYTIRTQEANTPGKGRAQNTVAFPDMRRGRVALCFATLLARCTGHPEPQVDYPTTAQAYGAAHGQLAYYHALEQQGHVRLVKNRTDLDEHIAAWQAWEMRPEPDNAPALGFVISAEGVDFIFAPDQLEEWWQAGLRLIGITHYGPGRYAGGTGTEKGLTDLGPPLLAEMERLDIPLDLTHCSDQAFWEALERYGGPVLASHNNCRALVPHQRQFSDAQLQVIFERDGVIGVAFDNWMLEPGWIVGQSSPENVTLETIVDHIDYICQLAGNSRHAAIGSDLDGGFGREETPRDLDTIADLQHLTGLLAQRGYEETDIAAIMHANWLRLLHQAWGE